MNYSLICEIPGIFHKRFSSATTFVGKVTESACGEKGGYLMSKITVNETVTRSVSFENSQVDIHTALDRCFQFLEEERFDEAHVIIEQILNIEPNNTNAHFANFLYQFKLSCAEDVVQNFKNCIAYKNSVFYKRIKRGAQTELSKKLDFCLGQASEQLEKFRIEEERRKEYRDHGSTVCGIVVFSAIGIGWIIMSWPDVKWYMFLPIVFAAAGYMGIKSGTQKQLDQQ